MKHFARWVFSQARQCGELGDEQAAHALFTLASRSNGGSSPDMLIFALFARLLGWRRTSKLVESARTLINKKPGRFTRSQSWIEKES